MTCCYPDIINRCFRHTKLDSLEKLPDKTVWSFFSKDVDFCLGKKCKWWDSCFHRKARIEQSKSEVLITNHALFFADVISGSKVLPEFGAAVLDEAHTLGDIATSHFAKEISRNGVKSFCDKVKVFLKDFNPGDMPRGDEYLRQIGSILSDIEREPGLFSRVKEIFGEREGTFSFDIYDFLKDIGIKGDLIALSAEMNSFSDQIYDHEKSEQLKAFSTRAEKMAETVDFIFNENRYDYAYWIDIRTGKKNKNYSFHASPVDVSSHMREFIFERISPVVLTSATLTDGKKDFSFIKKRLGLSDPLELVLDSPFDYKNNVLIYTPYSEADPVYNAPAYKEHLKQNIISLYETLGGRIFCLFTSYKMLDLISDNIARERADINLLRQGDMPRYVLLDVFKREPSSMLMGTSTFWQGVDVPGEALECVIITKFPFSVPTDPVNAVRIEKIKESGGHPFIDYQLPEAVILFKQGFGRLVRTKNDRGIVAILDPRLKTRPYGRDFLKALPLCRQSEDLNDVSSFFIGKR